MYALTVVLILSYLSWAWNRDLTPYLKKVEILVRYFGFQRHQVISVHACFSILSRAVVMEVEILLKLNQRHSAG